MAREVTWITRARSYIGSGAKYPSCFSLEGASSDKETGQLRGGNLILIIILSNYRPFDLTNISTTPFFIRNRAGYTILK